MRREAPHGVSHKRAFTAEHSTPQMHCTCNNGDDAMNTRKRSRLYDPLYPSPFSIANASSSHPQTLPSSTSTRSLLINDDCILTPPCSPSTVGAVQSSTYLTTQRHNDIIVDVERPRNKQVAVLDTIQPSATLRHLLNMEYAQSTHPNYTFYSSDDSGIRLVRQRQIAVEAIIRKVHTITMNFIHHHLFFITYHHHSIVVNYCFIQRRLILHRFTLIDLFISVNVCCRVNNWFCLH